MSESTDEDIVIKSYLDLYLKALSEPKPKKFRKIIFNRMMLLIKRRQAKNTQ